MGRAWCATLGRETGILLVSVPLHIPPILMTGRVQRRKKTANRKAQGLGFSFRNCVNGIKAITTGLYYLFNKRTSATDTTIPEQIEELTRKDDYRGAVTSGEEASTVGGGTDAGEGGFAGDTSPLAAFSACFSLTIIRIRMPS